MLVEQVAAAIRRVGRVEVVPRFRALAAGDISEKSPGDFVTVADQECERALSEQLRQIRDLPVVGEEAAAVDPTLLDLVASASGAWILDPIDGTKNFVGGDPAFVIMVALVEAGETTTAWVWHPETDSMLTAERGRGTLRNGRPVSRRAQRSTTRGVIKRKYMGEPLRSRLADFPATIGAVVPAAGSAGIEYAALIDGEIDFLAYWRTLPWDHAPCALLALEAGLRVARFDGSHYVPGDAGVGLLAATPEVWDHVATEIQLAQNGS